ncbi:MAG: UDP-3-O-(3-hydroxymyristoyl)glucosamine N-acyltransferase [Rhodospirillaceae bacterium]|nr:UDP-3-O-(3-hydroxymyristoyl)glucosamine N-acyltransferase [Rhodospirillaceae bacterium]
MTDPKFHQVAGPFSLEKLATIAGADLANGDPKALFHDVAPLDMAGPDDVSFLDNKRYADAFTKSKAGACIVDPGMADKAPKGMALLLTKLPYHGYGLVAQAFYPAFIPAPSIHSSAVVNPTAIIDKAVCIESGVVVGKNVHIGKNCHIAANTVIGDGVVVGDNCRIGPSVTLSCAMLGNNVIVHTGVRIGQDGFGFAMSPEGHIKVPQLGRVVIEDDVEIGANTTIDRGTGPDTIIGAGTKIDNLVQIGHNVRIGRNCIIVSHVGISGSTTLGDFVALGGQAGIAGHLTIGDGVQVAAQSGIMRDVAPGLKVGGSPALPFREWMRGVAAIENLGKKKGK